MGTQRPPQWTIHWAHELPNACEALPNVPSVAAGFVDALEPILANGLYLSAVGYIQACIGATLQREMGCQVPQEFCQYRHARIGEP